MPVPSIDRAALTRLAAGSPAGLAGGAALGAVAGLIQEWLQ
jgi:hypothetical protein